MLQILRNRNILLNKNNIINKDKWILNLNKRLFSTEEEKYDESKDNKKEKKKKNKIKNKKNKDKDTQEDANVSKIDYTKIMIEAIRGKKDPELEPLSEEEQKRNFEVGKKYNQMMMKRHISLVQDINMKIILINDAINALPPHLQEEAKEDDIRPVPTDRQFMFEAPPIEGFKVPNSSSE